MMIITRNLIFQHLGLCFLFLFTPGPGTAKNFYVDPSATSTLSDGSFAHPWKTMEQVTIGTYLLSPGDSVLFRRGIRYSGKLNIWSSGTAANPIVFTSFGDGPAPEFDNSVRDVITVYNRSYIVIDGFKITDRSFPDAERTQIAKMTYAIILDNSPYCTVKNCEISNAGVAIEVKKGSDYTLISGNYIHDLRMVRNTVGGDDDFGAVPVVLSSSHNTVQHNRFQDCWSVSFDYGFEGGSVELFGEIVSNNLIIYNTAVDCNGFIETGSASNGSILNNIVAYNKVINCGTAGVLLNEGKYKVSISGLQYYNNVFIETKLQYAKPLYLFWITADALADMLVLRNNIFWLSSGVNLVNPNLKANGIVHSNNVFRQEKGVVGFPLSKDELLVKEEALFISSQGNPVSWDYRPAKKSAIINFGKDVGLKLDFDAVPIIGLPDAGIFEYDRPIVSATVDPVKCYGDTAMVRIAATGGIPPYIGTGAFASVAGKFSFSVLDSRGRSDTLLVDVTQPERLELVVQKTPINAYGGGGSFSLSASGGIGPYTYNLNAAAFDGKNVYQSLRPGKYVLGVKDKLGCITMREDSIFDFDRSEYAAIDWPDLKFFPNPSNHFFQLNNKSYFSATQSIGVEVYSIKGDKIYEDLGNFDHLFSFGQNLPAGTYYARLTIGLNTRTIVLVKQ